MRKSTSKWFRRVTHYLRMAAKNPGTEAAYLRRFRKPDRLMAAVGMFQRTK